MASLYPDAPIISFSSLSKAYLAPGWRAGWMAVGRTDRLDDVLAAIKKLADGRLCSPGPMQYAIAAALDGDRSHEAVLPRRAARARRADHDCGSTRSTASPRSRRGRRSTRCRRCQLPPGVTDEDYVLALLRATGRPLRLRIRLRHRARGRLLPRRLPREPPSELSEIYDDDRAISPRASCRARRDVTVRTSD